MYLSKRTASVLRILANSEEPVTALEIANDLGYTVRTIRSDLVRARQWLQSTKTGVDIGSRAGVGLWLEGPAEGIQRIIDRLGKESVSCPDDVSSREISITYRLLTSPAVSMKSLLSDLAVSKSALQQAIKQCRQRLDEYHIAVRKAGRGLIAAYGDEQSVRKALAELADDPRSGLGEFTFKTILNAVESEDSSANYRLLDSTKTAIAMHLWATVERIRSVANSLRGAVASPAVRDPECLRRARSILSHVSASVRVSLPEEEQAYVALYLEGDKLRQDSMRKMSLLATQRDDSELLMAAAEAAGLITSFISKETGVNLDGDQWLFDSLKFHIAWSLSIVRSGAIATNPLKREVMRKYPGLFNLAKRAAQECEGITGEFVDDEAAYLAMHLGASLQRILTPQSVHVLVVCTTGLGSARFLSARLEAMCPEVKILGMASLAEARDMILSKHPDMVISTLETREPETPDLPWVRVSAFLSPSDIRRISEAWHGISRMPGSSYSSKDPLEMLERFLQAGPKGAPGTSSVRPPAGAGPRADSDRLPAGAAPYLEDAPAESTQDLPPDDALRVATAVSCASLSQALHLTADEQLGLLVHALLASGRWKNRDFAPPEERNPYTDEQLAKARKCFRGVVSELGFDLPVQEYICMLRYKGDDNL